VFSTFIIKELSTASNIKDRLNRHQVVRNLKMIQEFIIHNKINSNGIIILAGVNEYNKEIFEILNPIIKLNQFYYNCGKKFIIDRFTNLFESISGYIIFANGDLTNIYKFTNEFIKIKSLNGNLIKRHKKGGQSSIRFSRLAEESRLIYITHIIDQINQLEKTSNIWLFGSMEICEMIMKRKDLLIKINYGGFVNWNESTINNSKQWIEYLLNKKSNFNQIDEIINYLDTNIDMLDFDPINKNQMKYYLTTKDIQTFSSHANYGRIKLFEYIGVKYYQYENYDDNNNDNNDEINEDNQNYNLQDFNDFI